jgi:hypothetical protein
MKTAVISKPQQPNPLPPLTRECRVVSYIQRKTTTGFQSLSPSGERNGREVKSYGCIFIYSYKINLLYLRGNGGYKSSKTSLKILN